MNDGVSELPAERAAIGLIGLGLLLVAFAFLSGTSTLAGCDLGAGRHGIVGRPFGIRPSELSLRLWLSDLRIGWYDGCNTHSTSLFWPVGGTLAVLGGAVLYVEG